MNCADFETIVVDLARGVSLDATLKQSGLAHTHVCVRCAGRLKLEQSLSRSLRTLVKDDHALNAPPAVENALLAAFRANTEVAPVAAPVIAPMVQEAPLKEWFRQMRWALIPAFASAVLLVIFAAVRAWQPDSTPNPIIAEKKLTPSPVVTATPVAPEQPDATVPPQNEPQDEPQNLLAKASTQRAPALIKTTLNNGSARQRRGSVTVDVGEFVLDEPEAISAKDFLIFDYAQTLPPADSTHLMRVRMPREQLAPLGIPLPREMRNENFVNADFLVGSDGVPRAIRVANR